MTVLRNVLHDLIQKKLWPVAVALLAAIVAVPMVLGGRSDAGTATAVPSTPTPTAGALGARDVARAQVVSLDEQAATGQVDRPGKTRDPFVQHHVPKPVTTPTDTAAATKSAGDSTTGAGSTGATGGIETTTPSTPTATPTPKAPTATPKPAASAETYHVTLRFGEDGAEKTHTNVARLTPLPSSDNPFFVFLGLKSDGKSAVFLVDSDAVPSGDGTCEPSPTNCQQVVLQQGDMEFFELQSGTAGVVQYQLELTKISKGKAATAASAARAHVRESSAGREYIRQLVADDPTALDDWTFSPGLGLLVAKHAATAKASGTETGALPALPAPTP